MPDGTSPPGEGAQKGGDQGGLHFSKTTPPSPLGDVETEPPLLGDPALPTASLSSWGVLLESADVLLR